MWGRPPNFVLVDYYDRGVFEGLVFEVVARANGVVFERRKCCGGLETVSAAGLLGRSSGTIGVLVVLALFLGWW
jgi:hypothetical protein